jgi:hypothetical protein
MVLLGVVVLIAILAAYLSNCLPGLGTGGELGAPSSDATTPPSPSQAPAAGAAGDRIDIVVQGEQCRHGQAAAVPCNELCAALDRTRAATVDVALDATRGRHGTVEELRTCLRDAGFAHVRVHSE